MRQSPSEGLATSYESVNVAIPLVDLSHSNIQVAYKMPLSVFFLGMGIPGVKSQNSRGTFPILSRDPFEEAIPKPRRNGRFWTTTMVENNVVLHLKAWMAPEWRWPKESSSRPLFLNEVEHPRCLVAPSHPVP